MLEFSHKKSAFLIILALSGSISGCGLKGPLYQTPEKPPPSQPTIEKKVDTQVNQVPA
jgi:predicted small lipoprotein YifL